MISSSLLARVDPNKKTPRQFSLGMSDWTGSDSEGSDKENHDQRCRDDDDFQQPTRKKHRLDLALKKDSGKLGKNRFAQTVSTAHLATMTKPIIPKSTQKSTSWALRNFNDWREELS